MVSLHHAWSKILFLRFFTWVLPSMMKETDYAQCKHKGWGKASKYQTTDNSHCYLSSILQQIYAAGHSDMGIVQHIVQPTCPSI